MGKWFIRLAHIPSDQLRHRLSAASVTGDQWKLRLAVMVGPQIYPFRHRRKFTPFAHVLFGEAFYRDRYPAFGGFPAAVKSGL